jgi:hypothetical protein
VSKVRNGPVLKLMPAILRLWGPKGYAGFIVMWEAQKSKRAALKGLGKQGEPI